MPDKILLAIEVLEQIEITIENLLESTATITNLDELTKSADGMLKLNGICMSFIIIGEEIKRLDRYTEKQLLPNYPSVPWYDIMGMRDRLAHGYFEIDTDVIFDTLRNDTSPLLSVIK
ncbi:HepT-like ribonuclease domain-containing protein [Proteiniphilum sp.]|uniref:HepT-like ribonuclease domain-containing protein n=1 Tax=Proteiniphilum sp. TaxID=1926877 RepID=UPI00332904BE